MPATDQLRAALSDRYHIEREIGAGGMATVYLARDIKHDREVALKVLRSDLSAMIGSERFLAEVRITAKLDHPHILTLIDSGSEGGILYYVLPFVRGESLRAKLDREKQLSIEESLSVTKQIASALDYAHAQGVVHRDIKPENILLHEGLAVLADFGIALAVKEAGTNRLTETGLSLGTPQYMSPEQATGDRTLDRRSDLYSLGAVFYEMVAGEPPVTGPTAQVIIAKLLTEKPVKLRVVRDTVSPAMERATEKALAKIPADRFGSAGEFVSALSYSPPEEDGKPRARIPKVALAGAAAVLIISVAGWLILKSPSRGADAHVTFGERTQLTSSGRVSSPDISDDGKTLAYAVEECGASGCFEALELKEIATGSTRRLVEGSTGLGGVEISSDRRSVLFNGTMNGLYGQYIVSTLGGPPRFLLKGQAVFWAGGDSLLMIPWGASAKSHILVARLDGTPVDSIPIGGSEGEITAITAVPGSQRIMFALTDDEGEQWISSDRTGRRYDSRRFRGSGHIASGKATVDALWLPMSWGERPRPLMRVPFDASTGRWAQRGDTVQVGTSYSFSTTPDGSTLVIVEGTTEYTQWNLPFSELLEGKFTEDRRTLRSTSPAHFSLSRDGNLVLIGRNVVGQGSQARQWTVMPFGGGPETEVPGRHDWAYFFDSTKIELQSRTNSGHRLSVIDAGTGRESSVLSIPDSVVFHSIRLPSGGWMWIDDAGAKMQIQLDGETKPREFKRPPWYVFIYQILPSPDGNTVAMVGWKAPAADTLGVSLFSLSDGTSRQIWKGFAERGSVAWSADGSLLLETMDGVRTFHRLGTDGSLRRIGSAPGTVFRWNVSADLKKAAVTTIDRRGDAWMSKVVR
ncbi:MAG: protein kinase domain-containing protein [Gemmatimonadaceae bacterium]